MATFDQARLKINRASQHIVEAERRIKLVVGPEGQTSRIEIHPEARAKSVRYRLLKLGELPEIALVIGDAIHNLKTALDYAWLQVITASIPRMAGERPKFPIYPTVDLLEQFLTNKKIHIDCPRLSRFVFNIKPYDGGNFYLYPLHQMDIVDKHRLLIPSTTYGNVEGLTVKDHSGAVTGRTWGSELAEEFHVDFHQDIEIQDKGRVAFEIVFKEGPMKDMEVTGLLGGFSCTVLALVELMEKFVQP
ncbi:MAG TPA: hypothetical protein VFE22_05040 [Edaphobacter sp.]|jgi:hypothetical protein|nr:hypothetical protein [Edaphobacter sp.]